MDSIPESPRPETCGYASPHLLGYTAPIHELPVYAPIYGLLGQPRYIWMEVAMQDMRELGPRLQLDLPRGWPTLAQGIMIYLAYKAMCDDHPYG